MTPLPFRGEDHLLGFHDCSAQLELNAPSVFEAPPPVPPHPWPEVDRTDLEPATTVDGDWPFVQDGDVPVLVRCSRNVPKQAFFLRSRIHEIRH